MPCIVFTKGGGGWLEQIAELGPDVIGVDWTVDLGAARQRVGAKIALQGNLDPAVLFAPPEVVREQAVATLASLRGRLDGHVFNLGHGINQHTPADNVGVLVETVHAESRRLRGLMADRATAGHDA